MATIVDALTVTLGMDASGFERGRQQTEASLKATSDSATRTAKTMQAEGARAAEYFSAIRNEALSLIGVLIGGKGLESFIKDQTKALADLGRQAINIGESVPDLTAFSNAIERNGGSAQSARDSMLGYANAIERFKVFGDATVLQFLNPIGATVQDSPLQAYMKFVKYVEDHKNVAGGAQLINLIGHGLGYDQGLINATIQMGTVAKVNAELARSRELGVPTADMIAKVTALQTSFIALEQAATNLGNVMLASNAGWMKAFLDFLTKETVENPGVVEGITAITVALTALAAVRVSASVMGLTGLSGVIDSIFAALSRLSTIALPLALTGDTVSTPDQDQRALNALTPAQRAERARQPGQINRWLEQGWNWLRGRSGNSAIGGTSDASLSTNQRALLDAIAGGESTGADPYHQQNIGGGSAYGRYQFQPPTWAEISARTGLGDINNPAHQDRNAWALAAQEYRRYTFGRDLESDIGSGGHEADIAAALRGRWPSLPGGSQPNAATAGFVRRLQSGSRQGLTREQLGDTPANKRGFYPAGGGFVPDPALIPPTGGPRAASADNSTAVDIGTLNVHTQATDASSIAADIHQSLVDAITVQANRGPQ